MSDLPPPPGAAPLPPPPPGGGHNDGDVTVLAGGVTVPGRPVGAIEGFGMVVASLFAQGAVATVAIFAGLIPLTADIDVLLSDPVPLLGATVVGQVLGLAVIAGWLHLRGSLTSAVRAVRPTTHAWKVAVGVGAIGVPVVSGLAALINWSVGIEEADTQMVLDMLQSGGAGTLLAWVAAGVLAPVVEEVTFRGAMFTGLRRRFGLWPSALVSAVVFSLAHAGEVTQPGQLVGFVVLGVAFAWAYERTGSLTVPIVAHAVFNLIGLTLATTLG